MHYSTLVRSLVAAVVLITPALATPAEAAAPAGVSHLPTPATDNFVTIYGDISNGTSGDQAAMEKRYGTIDRRSYYGSCDYCGVKGTMLKCEECRDTSGKVWETTLDLNKCLVNDNGNIQWRINGGYGASCGADFSNSYFSITLYSVRCPNSAKSWGWTQIDLNERIHNDNGRLVCVVPR